eukprot:g41914.t1
MLSHVYLGFVVVILLQLVLLWRLVVAVVSMQSVAGSGARRVTSLPSDVFLKVQIDLANGQALDAQLLQRLLTHAIKKMFGAMGAGLCEVDVLDLQSEQNTALVLTNRESLVKLWGALTLCTQYQETACRILVLDSSPYLFSLANPARLSKQTPVPCTWPQPHQVRTSADNSRQSSDHLEATAKIAQERVEQDMDLAPEKRREGAGEAVT